MVPQRWARRAATNAHVSVVRKAHVLGVAAARQSALLHDACFHLNFSWKNSKTDTMEAPRVGILKAGSATRIISVKRGTNAVRAGDRFYFTRLIIGNISLDFGRWFIK